MTGQLILSPVPTSFAQAGTHLDFVIMDSYPDGIYILALKLKSGGSKVLKLTKSAAIGIHEIDNDCDLIIYPNPVKDIMTLEFAEMPMRDFQLSLINTLGQIVYLAEVISNKK